MKKDRLIHIRVGEQLGKEMEFFIDEGIFSSQTELAREAIRALILRYKEQYPKKGEENKGR